MLTLRLCIGYQHEKEHLNEKNILHISIFSRFFKLREKKNENYLIKETSDFNCLVNNKILLIT